MAGFVTWGDGGFADSSGDGADLSGFTDCSVLYVTSEQFSEDPANLCYDAVSETLTVRNFTVLGTFTTNEIENLSISDQFIYLNVGYDTPVQQDVGLVANFRPTSTADTVTAGAFTAGIAATSNPTVDTDGSDTFGQGDIILISGTTNDGENDGYFEVEDHTGTTLTVRGVGTVAAVETFCRQQFAPNASDSAVITNTNVTVLHSNNGEWEQGHGRQSGINYTKIASSAQLLFGALNVSATITDRWLLPGAPNRGALTDRRGIPLGRSGVLTNLTVHHQAPNAASVSNIDYTVEVNGSPTALTVTLLSLSGAIVRDSTNEVIVSSEDNISIIVEKGSNIGQSPLDVIATVEFQ